MVIRPAKRRLLPHGGARRTGAANKPTHNLTKDECFKLMDAVEAAWRRGQPFNRFITLLWEHGGVDSRDNATATRQFLKLVADWLRQHGFKLLHCWVQEWGQVNGAHVHILLHIPPRLDPLFRSRPSGWAQRCLPGPYVKGVVQTKRIAFGSDPEASPHAYRADVMGRLHYMLKCAPAALESELGMVQWRWQGSGRWGYSSTVFGKRAARWQDRPK